MTSLAKISADTQEGSAAKPLRVVICGEVNSGKSTLINAILRGRFLPDLFGAKSRPFIHVRPGETTSITTRSAAGKEVELEAMTSNALMDAASCEFVAEADHLEGFEIVEMPFLNERDISNEQIAFVESADLLVWLTIASQAWRLSEKTILDRCEKRPRAAVLVVSRGDKLRSDEDREKLYSRMARETGDYFSEIVMMHGKDKILEAAADSDEAWETTGGPEVLTHLQRLSVEVRAAQARALAAVEELAASQNSLDEPEDEQPGAEIVHLNKAALDAEPVHDAPEAVDEAPEVVDEAPEAVDEAPEPVDAAPEPVDAAQEATFEIEEPAAQTIDVSDATPLPDLQDEPSFTSIPDTPRVSAGARKDMADLLPALHGCSAVGLAPLGADEEVDFLKGDVDDWAEIGPVCKSLYEADARLDNDVSGEPILSHVTMRRHQFITQSYPRKGVALFMIAPTARLNHALARTAFQRLSRALEQTR